MVVSLIRMKSTVFLFLRIEAVRCNGLSFRSGVCGATGVMQETLEPGVRLQESLVYRWTLKPEEKIEKKSCGQNPGDDKYQVPGRSWGVVRNLKKVKGKMIKSVKCKGPAGDRDGRERARGGQWPSL